MAEFPRYNSNLTARTWKLKKIMEKLSEARASPYLTIFFLGE
jgi:hypothetical protein